MAQKVMRKKFNQDVGEKSKVDICHWIIILYTIIHIRRPEEQ